MRWYDDKNANPKSIVTPDSIWSPAQRTTPLKTISFDSGYLPQDPRHRFWIPASALASRFALPPASLQSCAGMTTKSQNLETSSLQTRSGVQPNEPHPLNPLASTLDTSLGYGIPLRSTSCTPAVVRWYDDKNANPKSIVTPDSIWSPAQRKTPLYIHGSDSGYQPRLWHPASLYLLHPCSRSLV
ncbi:MAG: hypothetical protein ISR73_13285 [Gammaproteobacteria bacterium]|nr:hypothetical protein [Gammaproteobacteria bacterium]